jgi:aryl-alcohol dehydrogenase-like predicted oxidoreductase
MNYRYLGKQRLKVSAIGYGCSTFVGQRNDVDQKQAIYVLGRKLPCG